MREKIRVFTHHWWRDLIIGNLSWSCQGGKKAEPTNCRRLADWWPQKSVDDDETQSWGGVARQLCARLGVVHAKKNEKWNYIERKLNKYQPDLAPKSFPSYIVDGRRRRRRRTPLTAQKNYLAPYLSTEFPSAFLVYSSVDFVCCRFFSSDVVIPSKTCA